VSAVGVNYGVHPEEELMRYDALACFNDIREIVPFLDGHHKG